MNIFMKTNQANCAAVVVSFYPDHEILSHISLLCSLCHTVVIVDNTPAETVVSYPSHQNLILHRNRFNKGLAYALNKGIELAHDAGFEHIFLLDQDTRVPLDYFNKMLDFKYRVEAVSDRCAFCVPNFYDRNSQSFANFPIIRPFSFRHTTCVSFDYGMKSGVLIAITSGMLISYSMFKEIGNFPEDYFIDFIDNEYSLRAGDMGLKVAVNCNVSLDHAIGNRRTHRLWKLTIKPNHHSHIRRYYIARNGIIAAAKYMKDYPAYVLLIGLRLVHESLSILIFEKFKSKKLIAMIIGCWHAFLKRTGKYEAINGKI